MLIIYSIFSFSSCVLINKEPEGEISTTLLDTNHSESDTTVLANDDVYQSVVNTDIGGGSITTRKYRVNYYDVPYQFILIVGEDVYWEWDEQYNNENPDETNVMVMKRFIEYFDISKECFERANLEWAKVILNKMGSQPNMNPKDFANQETDEVYNADIIYTFDDKIINEYYMSGYYPYIYESDYEEAVASGEYISQTKDWIDIAQMEAEIIAKYGEAEIVTEAETTVESETENAEVAEITEAPEEITQTPSETKDNITE